MPSTVASPHLSTPSQLHPEENPSHRRAHDDEDSTGSSDSNGPPAHKRRKTDSHKVVSAAGARFAIMHDMFRSFDLILTNGSNAAASGGQATACTRQSMENTHYTLYKALEKILPDLTSRMAGGSDAVTLLEEHLESGRKQILQQVIHHAKIDIVDWLNCPTLNKDNKSTRGFRHEECGKRLCPAGYDYNDLEVRESLQNYGSKKYRAVATEYPAMVWRNERFDPAKPWEGFGRNELMIKCGSMMLQGPKAARNVSMTGDNPAPPASTRSINTKSRTRKWHLKAITPAFIACAAVLVRYGLSDESSFPSQPPPDSENEHSAAPSRKRRKPRHWDYVKFYQYLVRTIEVDMPVRLREDLLAWWTSRIIGSSGPSGNDSDYSEASDDEDGPSIMALLAADGRQATAPRCSSSTTSSPVCQSSDGAE